MRYLIPACAALLPELRRGECRDGRAGRQAHGQGADRQIARMFQDADTQNLHGKPRKVFLRKCKKGES